MPVVGASRNVRPMNKLRVLEICCLLLVLLVVCAASYCFVRCDVFWVRTFMCSMAGYQPACSGGLQDAHRERWLYNIAYTYRTHKFLPLRPEPVSVVYFDSSVAHEDRESFIDSVLLRGRIGDAPKVYDMTASGVVGYDVFLTESELETYLDSCKTPVCARDLAKAFAPGREEVSGPVPR